jgi:hypothetical protein
MIKYNTVGSHAKIGMLLFGIKFCFNIIAENTQFIWLYFSCYSFLDLKEVHGKHLGSRLKRSVRVLSDFNHLGVIPSNNVYISIDQKFYVDLIKVYFKESTVYLKTAKI